jgi:hypothetical protein
MTVELDEATLKDLARMIGEPPKKTLAPKPSLNL